MFDAMNVARSATKLSFEFICLCMPARVAFVLRQV